MKIIPMFNGRYAATEDGRIYSIKMKRFLKGEKTNNGYWRVLIDKKHYTVHSLIALAFLGEKPNEDLTIDHIDQNKDNNYPINLRYITLTKNRHNRNDYRGISEIAKENNLSETQVRNGLNKGKSIEEIIEMSNSGYGRAWIVKYKNEEYTIKELSKLLNIKPETLKQRIRNNWPEEIWNLSTEKIGGRKNHGNGFAEIRISLRSNKMPKG